MFEITSAYATCGLSLGTPQKNTSLVGVLGTLSKLIIIVVMVRGRHRGLPLAIDRSVMLPNEALQMDENESVRLARHPTRSTMSARGGGLESVRPETDLERFQRQQDASGEQDFGFSFTQPAAVQPTLGRPSESEEESSSSKEAVPEATEMKDLSSTDARVRRGSTITIQSPEGAGEEAASRRVGEAQ
jgi:hypothetical protein